jgi:integrating conjugative element protein (TIGR03765 family)
MVNVKRAVQLLVALMLSFNVHAAIEVIGDFGGEPVEMILAEIMPKEDLPEEPVKNVDIEKAIKGMVVYPFSPTIAIVGKFVSKDFTERQNEISSPVALIGTDKVSINWLRAYKNKLQEIGATVFVVEAESESNLKVLLASYSGQIMPLQNSDKIFQKFNLQKYPILITADGIYQ